MYPSLSAAFSEYQHILNQVIQWLVSDLYMLQAES
jgi:hypothetical protein